MNQKNIITVMLLAVLGLAVVGYLRAVPGIENQTKKHPQIEITPRTFDFKEIEYGRIAEHVFTVRNIGNEVLEIKKVATSCACTTASIEKEIIEPNKEAKLKVTYNTGLMSGSHAKGKQERIIYIKSNDPVSPQVEVTIHADVK